MHKMAINDCDGGSDERDYDEDGNDDWPADGTAGEMNGEWQHSFVVWNVTHGALRQQTIRSTPTDTRLSPLLSLLSS